MGVSPPRTLSPGLTRISVSSGRSTSVREPNRIIPNRSPLSTTSPTCFQAQILRAMAPVIWRTTIVTPFPSNGPCTARVDLRRGRIPRIEEPAGHRLRMRNLACDGRPIHVNVEDGQEDCHAFHTLVDKLAFPGLLHLDDQPVRRGDSERFIARRLTLGIPKKV